MSIQHDTDLVRDHTSRLGNLELGNAVQTEILTRIEKKLDKVETKVNNLEHDVKNGLVDRKVQIILDQRFANEIRKYTFRIVTGVAVSGGALLLVGWLSNIF